MIGQRFELFIFLILLSSCATSHQTVAHNLTLSQIADAREKVTDYDSESIEKLIFEELGVVQGKYCNGTEAAEINRNQSDLKTELRYLTLALGGNGFYNFTCEKSIGTVFSDNCWDVIPCKANAIRVKK
jgi:hypothetical protein